MNVAAIQRALTARGHVLGKRRPSGKADDGVMGPKKKSAVNVEQIAHGLPRKDGVVDGPTEELLLGKLKVGDRVRGRGVRLLDEGRRQGAAPARDTPGRRTRTLLTKP